MTIDRKRTFFKLYSYCIPVLGKQGAIIVNLQKSNYTAIPPFLYEVISEYENTSLKDVQLLYDDEADDIFRHLEQLQLEDVGFFTTDPQCFPKMELQWNSPEKIKFGVLQIERYDRFPYGRILKELDALLCKNIEVWFVADYTLEEVGDLLSHVEGSMLRSLTLIMRYDNRLQTDDYVALRTKYKKLARIYLHNAPFKIKRPKDFIFGTTEDLGDHEQVFSDVGGDEYIIYLEFFMESQQYNPYYNQKICIDRNGFIKNCLTHENHFGHIDTHRLEDVYQDASFRDLWYACNDRVLGLKDSEFRYITLNTRKMEKVNDQFYRIL